WKVILERLEAGDMPPKKALQPGAERTAVLVSLLRAEMKKAGRDLSTEAEYPHRGNYVNHALLFKPGSQAKPATSPRIWRVSPFAYREFVGELDQSNYYIMEFYARERRGVQVDPAIVPAPFGLTNDEGFRDYAFRYEIGTTETQQMIWNAHKVIG